jgi:HipA-like protein
MVAAVSDGAPTTTAPRSVTATRYVTPLREGGSMPGLVEADDDGLYVLKFRGAGQGPRALVAELVAGELGRALGLDVPEIVLIDLDADLGRAEPDPEIQELIAASGGRNVGLDFLPAALPFVPGAGDPPSPDLAAAVVWFDALMTNVDRTPRNPNLLWWHGRLWLIDHGAALYLQHGADDLPALARRPFPLIAQHVLLPYAGSIADADVRLAPLVTPALVEAVVSAVPAEWLGDADREEARRAYVEYLLRRLEAPRGFVEEADAARGR